MEFPGEFSSVCSICTFMHKKVIVFKWILNSHSIDKLLTLSLAHISVTVTQNSRALMCLLRLPAHSWRWSHAVRPSDRYCSAQPARPAGQYTSTGASGSGQHCPVSTVDSGFSSRHQIIGTRDDALKLGALFWSFWQSVSVATHNISPLVMNSYCYAGSPTRPVS